MLTTLWLVLFSRHICAQNPDLLATHPAKYNKDDQKAFHHYQKPRRKDNPNQDADRECRGQKTPQLKTAPHGNRLLTHFDSTVYAGRTIVLQLSGPCHGIMRNQGHWDTQAICIVCYNMFEKSAKKQAHPKQNPLFSLEKPRQMAGTNIQQTAEFGPSAPARRYLSLHPKNNASHFQASPNSMLTVNHTAYKMQDRFMNPATPPYQAAALCAQWRRRGFARSVSCGPWD